MPHGKQWVWIAGVLSATVALLAIVGAVLPDEAADSEAQTVAATPTPTERLATARPPSNPDPTSTPRPPDYDLALISATCTARFSIVECQGFVQNISGRAIESIQVYVHAKDEAGVPRASDWSFVDFNPLLPNQQSPWSVYIDHNPALTNFTFDFREYLGGALIVRDDR